jgi:hypothetical protein
LKLFVGIDVSSQELEACFMNPDGDTIESFKVENNLHGASHLRDRIVAAADKLASTEIHIGLASTKSVRPASSPKLAISAGEFGGYCRKKYAEVPKHQHKRALVLTARKLVRLADVLLRNDQLYTPRKKVTAAKD